jgi:hypothetical protein
VPVERRLADRQERLVVLDELGGAVGLRLDETSSGGSVPPRKVTVWAPRSMRWSTDGVADLDGHVARE